MTISFTYYNYPRGTPEFVQSARLNFPELTDLEVTRIAEQEETAAGFELEAGLDLEDAWWLEADAEPLEDRRSKYSERLHDVMRNFKFRDNVRP